jgi:hypothetical protein
VTGSNIPLTAADCQAKNRLFFAVQAEKFRILGFNSDGILLPGSTKGGIKTFFSVIRTAAEDY